MSEHDPERIPVIVGVGQLNDRPHRPSEGLDPVGLMGGALKLADADAGGGLLADCDSLSVVKQLAWPQLNPIDGVVADALGIKPSHLFQTAMPNGDSPIRLLHEAANRIGSGQAKICAVTGGEALRTASQLAKQKTLEESENTDALRNAAHRVRHGYPQSYGLVVPTDVYPLYENSIRAAYGQNLVEGQVETSAIWSLMSEVAAHSEHAWLRKAASPDEIITPSAENRRLAFPYTKLQVANSSVNQGAGFILASLAEARRRGVSDERVVHVGYGAAAHESENFLERDRYDGSPSLTTSLMCTMALNEVATQDLSHVELYSCFPCVPKMARRVLDWPVDRPVTVFGGLTFGGGPIGNYMSHAVVTMVEKLRGTKDKGLLFANGGYATHNHSILLSGVATGAKFPQDFDYQSSADRQRRTIPELDKEYSGPAEVETYTVFFGRDNAPRAGVVIARAPGNRRTLAAIDVTDERLVESFTSGRTEPVGRKGFVEHQGKLAYWHFS